MRQIVAPPLDSMHSGHLTAELVFKNHSSVNELEQNVWVIGNFDFHSFKSG
jgi:hypothetical protein